MTVGIVAVGTRAGLAVFRALQAVERVAEGSIGGFAVFAAVTEDAILRYETQRGGSATLFTAGEWTGGEPEEAAASARLAGIISSGPDRPAPLSGFLPAAAGIGLVSGHRLPQTPGRDGIPLNQAVLSLLGAGQSVRQAVDFVLDANPSADAGLIAGGLGGEVYARNSARVAGRPDLGHARGSVGDATVEVLHNAVHPLAPLAGLAAEVALDVMLRRREPAGEVTLRAGTPVTLGETDSILVGEDGVVQEVQTSDGHLITGRWNCVAVYLGSCVMRGDRCIGTTLTEPNMVVEDGRLVSMSGQQEVRIGFRLLDKLGLSSHE
jgi:hypothetical protein